MAKKSIKNTSDDTKFLIQRNLIRDEENIMRELKPLNIPRPPFNESERMWYEAVNKQAIEIARKFINSNIKLISKEKKFNRIIDAACFAIGVITGVLLPSILLPIIFK